MMCTQLAVMKSGVSRKWRTDQKVTAIRKPNGTTKNRSCHASGGPPNESGNRRFGLGRAGARFMAMPGAGADPGHCRHVHSHRAFFPYAVRKQGEHRPARAERRTFAYDDALCAAG